MKKIFLFFLATISILLIVQCAPQDSGQKVESNVNTQSQPEMAIAEYCFQITDKITIGAKKVTTTPGQFLQENPNVLAVINGVYYGADDDLPQGTVYLADGQQLGSGKGSIRGYFTVDQAGNQILVQERLSGKYSDYWLVIGTHPILVYKGEVHSQAKEERYNLDQQGEKKLAFRSAIGTKDKKDICFTVSKGLISMQEWAEKLSQAGYYHALNLDGGPVSELAVRDGAIVPPGSARVETRLVIFSYYQE